MSVFIFSLLLGVLLHQIYSIIQPVVGSRRYRFGRRIVVWLPERTYLIWKASSLAIAFLLFISVVTLIVTRNVHPPEGFAYRFADALTSPHMAAAMYGGLVGILLGNLLNRILKNAHDYKFTSSDRLEVVLIFTLFILGIGGEEFLRSSAQHISKISVGTTTEISFSENQPKPLRTSAEQPSGAFRNTQGDSGGSAGLDKLYDIGSPPDISNMNRDNEFIEILARYEREPVPDLVPVSQLAEKVLSPMARCLSGIFRLNGDSTFIEHQLSPLSEALQELATQDKPDTKMIKKTLEERLYLLAQYVKRLPAPGISCPEVISAADSADVVNVESIAFLISQRGRLPYAAMAYASVMAALHHYESAVITLDNWVRSRSTNTKKTAADRWYLLRARFAESLFLDEWIRQRGPAASSWLRQTHIDNLKEIVDGMESFTAILELSQRNSDYRWTTGLLGASGSGDDGLCSVPPVPRSGNSPERAATLEEKEQLGTIYNAYLSARKDFVDHALKHPIMKRKSASTIGSNIESLMKLSLRCTNAQTRAQHIARLITRAEHIERYVRSEVNLMENMAPLKSTEESRDRIRDAQQLLVLAFQLIEPEVTKGREEKAQPNKPLQERIDTNPALELYEMLLATQGQLQDFSEHEITH